jgi:hypothetical protein
MVARPGARSTTIKIAAALNIPPTPAKGDTLWEHGETYTDDFGAKGSL